MNKNKRNTQKGITLIALIITIIVLLILAVVSIRLVVNNGILGKAEKGVKVYSESETEEKVKLAYADYQMGKLTDSSYTFEQALQNGKVAYTSVTGSDAEGYIVTATLSDGTEKKLKVTSTGVSKLKTTVEEFGLQIGDYVAYDEGTGYSTTIETSESGYVSSQTKTTEDLGWRVLGVNEKGELELISDNPTTATIYLRGETGYLNGENVLKDMCNELYGKGTYASSARSLKVDDINKLGNYDPTAYSGYGSLWQYQFPSGETYMQSRQSTDNGATWTDWTDITSSSYQTFRMPGADTSTTISVDNPGISEPLKYTYYYYIVSNYVKQTTSDGKSMADIITKGTGTSNLSQWLASPYVICLSGNARFGLRTVFGGGVNRGDLFYSYGDSDCYYYRVRPVVSLKSDIQIEKTDANDGSTLEKACIIK